MQFVQITHPDGINMNLLEIQLAVVKRLRELYPDTDSVYNIKTRML